MAVPTFPAVADSAGNEVLASKKVVFIRRHIGQVTGLNAYEEAAPARYTGVHSIARLLYRVVVYLNSLYESGREPKDATAIVILDEAGTSEVVSSGKGIRQVGELLNFVRLGRKVGVCLVFVSQGVGRGGRSPLRILAADNELEDAFPPWIFRAERGTSKCFSCRTNTRRRIRIGR